jgi:hypothetical protein
LHVVRVAKQAGRIFYCSIELGRRLGVTQTTAWKIKHKLMQVMMERDAGKRLSGRIEVDDVHIGGERNGGKRGRCSAGKTPIVIGSGRKAALTPAFKWVNTALANVKNAMTGTNRAVSNKHLPRNPAEFEYRFNRRYDLAAMTPRLGWAAVRTPPLPYRLLKLAAAHA